MKNHQNHFSEIYEHFKVKIKIMLLSAVFFLRGMNRDEGDINFYVQK